MKSQFISKPLLVVGLALALLPAAVSKAQSVGKMGRPMSAPDLLPGETVTLLPDGTQLLLGGEAKNGPVATAAILDPHTNKVTLLSSLLHQARAWHTATVLPDGTVLVLGGIDASGSAIGGAEVFDPKTRQFTLLPSPGLTPRAYHSATLLTDGTVLIVGGTSGDGATLGTAELWDPASKTATSLPAGLQTPRRQQTATLLADGDVLIWGGVDSAGKQVPGGEVFDPDAMAFTPLQSPPQLSQSGQQAPQVAGSVPEDGTGDVPVGTPIGIRFSEPLAVPTINAGTVALSSTAGPVSATVTPAEGGMLAFVMPKQPLQAGMDYTVSLSGLTDPAGHVLPDSEIKFTTEGLVSEDEAWTPQPGDDWKTWRPKSPAQSLPALQASPGVTAIAGQVLRLNGKPLANVTLEVDGIAARTDKTGRFLLKLGPDMSGKCTLVIDGSTADGPGKTYGLFQWLMDVKPGVTNALPFTIWMPLLDTRHAVSIPSPTTRETVVTTPLMPGLELYIPAGTVIKNRNGSVVHQISITPIPVDRPPFPLPDVRVPIYFTIQPGGAVLHVSNPAGAKGARLYYPNTYKSPPGMPYDFWNYDARPNSRWSGWYIYGHGEVAPDGKEIIPDTGVVIYGFTGAMVGGPNFAPPGGPAPGGKKQGGDPVDLGTGLFVPSKTDLFLPDILPIVLTRTYRPGDSWSRAFGIGTTHPYDIFLVGDTFPYTYLDLILPDGGRVYYPRISPGTSYTDAVYESTSTPTIYHGSTIRWNGNGWTLTLKNGTVYTFPDSFEATTPQAGALISITDRYGNALTLTRDSNHNLTQITSPNGRFIRFTYDSSNRITQAEDNIGRTVKYTYDSGGRLSTATDPNGGVTTYTYDSSNEMLTITDARSITYLTNQYDSNGRVIKQTLADGSTYQFAYTLDSNGNVTQTNVTDPRDNVEQVTFNSSGYALTDTYALGKPEQQEITYVRDPNTNLVQSVTDALNRQTTYTYDSMGNVTSITALAGTSNAVTTSFTYDPTFNQVTSITDPLSHTTTLGYDSRGNLTSITDPLGHQTTMAYNYLGQPTSVTDPLSNMTQFGYDGGDLVSITDPLGRATSRFADSAGRLVSVTDPLGNATVYTYDPLNELTQVKDPLGGVTSFAYDPNGNLLSVTDANNHATSFVYDNMDRRVSRKDPLGRVESFQYDADGNLTQFTDRKGQVTTFSYDGLNRKTLAGFGTQPGPVYQSSVTYTYDAGNRLTQAVDSASGTITRAWDGLNRLTSETTPQGSVSYTYDNAGRRTSMTVAGQPAVNYSYDNDNRLSQISQGSSTIGFSYDNASRRTSLTLPNGVVVNYTYSQASQLTGISYQAGSTNLGNLTYGYDNDGRRVSVGGSFARTGLPQAVSAAVYDAANELTQWGATNLTYDLNGNLTSDGANSYTWNARNQLASVNVGTAINFQYDAFGRRIQNAVGNQLLYDGANAVEQISDGTAVSSRLTGGVDEFFSRTDSAGAFSPLADALGSVIALTDSGGNLQTQYTYEPFGSVSVSGPPSSNTFQFTGRENDGTGLYYYRARYYSPIYQRFISEDPIGFLGGDANLYAYTFDAPTDFADPGGRQVGAMALGGAEVGSFAGPVGTAVGAAIGAAIGGVAAYEAWKAYQADDANPADAVPQPVPDNPPDTAHKKPPKKPGCKQAEPLPPGWTPDWESMPSSRKHGGWSWYPTEGGEWHWHAPDDYHTQGHWDYNPWDQWNSKWQNVPHDPGSGCPP